MDNIKQRRTAKALVLMGLGLILMFAPLMYQSPIIKELLGDYCNPIQLGQFRKEADQLILGIVEAEKVFDEIGKLPTYADVKLDQYISRATTMNEPACVHVVYVKLSCALMDGQEYLQRKSQLDGGSDSISDQYYSGYKSCLREYYFAMDELDQCFPFCKEQK